MAPLDDAAKHEFEQHLNGCLDVMYAVALRFTRNRDDAEDLVADACLKALQCFHQLKNQQRFKPWIMKIMTNLFISHYRHAQRQPIMLSAESENEEQPFSLFDQLASPFALWQHNPEKLFINQLASEEISKAIDALPDEYRLVVTLCDIEELTYQEVATLLKVPTGTVRSRLHRARARLQKALWELGQSKGYSSPPL